MTEQFCGSIISVDCGEILGIYEGEVIKVDSVGQTISLKNVLRNGVKFQVSEITLRSQDIKSLDILQIPPQKPKQSTSIGQNQSSAFQQPAHKNNDQVVENIVKQKNESKKKNPQKNTERKWQKEKDAACFNVCIDSTVLNKDFDFEKNLALFDKQAVFDEIDANSKNEAVKLVDCNKRTPSKYRHDENVLTTQAPMLRQISVPCSSKIEYVTDSGLVVPSVTVEFKSLLLKKAQEFGLSKEVQIEMVGRGASEMVLQLLGGSHRLNPQNCHQRPTVIILCGAHVQGAQAINCGRHLANHCVNVIVFCPPLNEKMNQWFRRELGLFSLSGGAKVSSTAKIPSQVDIVLSSLESYESGNRNISDIWTNSAKLWVSQSKAPILCLDPAPENSLPNQKWILSPVLPFYFKNQNASVYICDVGLPKGIFQMVSMSYASPFGSKFVIPLYAKSS